MKKTFLFLIILTFSIVNIFGQTDYDMAFDILAITQVSPPSIKLKWELTAKNTQISVSRKLKDDASWGSAVVLAANATEYTDNAVLIGKVYEYYVNGNGADEYISVGINVPLVDYRGICLLVVENSLSVPLADEINRLMMDIRGDGWQVVKLEVAKSATPADVKIVIKNEYLKDTVNTKAVFLLGQVPMPLSGCTCPDGHGDHCGAWGADMYYGDMVGVWTDATANCAGTWNANIPGDGKFDQNNSPAPVKLQIGRADMSKLPVFTESYTELQRRYLKKDHYYKITKIVPPRKAFVTDGFRWGFAWSGFYYFNALLGKSNVYYPSATALMQPYENYMWLYASAAGESNGFVATGWHSDQFAVNTYCQVFTMLFGSYFGDYQMSNNFMRAALASKGWILSCSWAGRPPWFYHHMANGENIGYAAKLNMNNSSTYMGGYSRAIHIGLMGDPTLRQDMVRPPANVNSSVTAGHVKITWSPPVNDTVDGYHIYKAKALDSVFVRVTNIAVTDTFWTDTAAAPATYYYQVKSFRLQMTRCGSYYNTSRGMFASNDVTVTDYPLVINSPRLVNPIPDQTGTVKKVFNYDIPANTFADDDPDEKFTYSAYKSDSTALPAGWIFNPTFRTIGTLPAPSKPVKLKVVVKVVSMENAFATDTFEITIGYAIGNPDIYMHKGDLQIYPNPAAASVNLSFFSECICNAEITIVDIAGRQVSACVIPAVEGNNDTELSLGLLTDGIYFITVKTTGHIYKGRVVITK